MRLVVATAILVGGGCSSSERAHRTSAHAHPPQVIRAIERALHDQLGVIVRAHCASICGLPSSCTATLPDRTELPVRAQFINDAWSIELATPAITTAPIVAYVTAELVDLGLPDEHVRCDPPIRIGPVPGDRIVCTLGTGGRATVAIDPVSGLVGDVELALEPSPPTAGGPPPPVDDAQLEAMSRALAHLADDDDDDHAADTSPSGDDKPTVRK